MRGLSDQLTATTRSGRPATSSRSRGGWKIAGSGAFADHDGLDEPDPEVAVRVEAEARLQHGRVRELGVHRLDAPVGAVVEAAVDADRPVDAMHHPHVVASEAPQSREVEVERVEEAPRRRAGEPVLLDLQTAVAELAGQSAEELVAASRRRRRGLVEDGEVGALRRARRGSPAPSRAAEPTRRASDRACTTAARGFVRRLIAA